MRCMRHPRFTAHLAVLGLLLTGCGGGADGDGGAASGDAGPGAGPEVTLTLGHPFPGQHLIQTGAIEPFVEEVREATGGTVEIEIIPGGGLGPGPGVYENVVAGAQDIGWSLQGYTAGRFPVTQVVEMPFMFESAADATDTLWTLYEEFPEFQEEYQDVHVLGLWTHDLGELWTTGQPITTMDDVSGLTLRAPGPMQNDLIAELGGAPVAMPAPELFDSLERGVIDGLMIGTTGLQSFNLFELLDHGVQCGCYVAAQFLTMNSGAWDGLSPEQQAAVDEVAGRTFSMRAAEAYDAAAKEAVAQVEETGIEQTVLEGAELDRWRAAGDVVIQNWIEEREGEGTPGQEMYDRLLELVGD